MIYHITSKVEWLVAKAAGIYEPESLASEGFIHCCTEEQFAQVASFYFTGRAGLVALEIDPEKLQASVKFEGEEGAVAHPHIYGPIHIEAVVNEADLVPEKDGSFIFPFKPVIH